MSDYRNTPIKFLNAGLQLNQPPEGLTDFTWRKLDNVRVLTEGVLEARPHTTNFPFAAGNYGYKQFTEGESPSPVYNIYYPDSFLVGPALYMCYVGKLKSGEDALLTIHEAPSQIPYPWESYFPNSSTRFSCFLNGIPIIQVSQRTGQPYPALTLSNPFPTVVRVLSPNGPSMVIIDGRWKIFPSEIDMQNPSTRWPTSAGYGSYGVIAYDELLEGGYLTTSNLRPIGAYRVGVGIDPFSVTATGTGTTAAPQVSAWTTGSLTGEYYYRATFKGSVNGNRSIATLSSTVITCTASGVQVEVMQPLDPQADLLEVWRLGGTVGSAWRKVYSAAAVTTATTHLPLMFVDTLADTAVVLNEALDVSLVKPFPATDIKGASYSLLDPSPIVSNAELVQVTNGSTVVSVAGTSGDVENGTDFWEGMEGYYFHAWEDSQPYLVISVTQGTTASAACLVLNTTYSGASASGTYYMVSRDWVLPKAFGPFQGQYVFWLGDPVKKTAFYWNKVGKVDLSLADGGYNTVTDPSEELVNGFIYGGLPYVFSKKRLYALDFLGSDITPSFSAREIQMSTGLAGTWAFQATRLGLVYLSWDGIYVTDCGGGPATKLSENLNPIFRGESVADIQAVDWDHVDEARICVTSRDIHFFYVGKTDGITQHLVMDINGRRWGRWISARNFSYAYEMENLDPHGVIFAHDSDPYLSYYTDATAIDGNETFTCRARTGSWDGGIPLTDKEFGVLLLDFDPDGAEIEIVPRYNSDTETGTTISTGTSGDTAGRRTIPLSLGDIYRRSISLEFIWTETSTCHPKFYQAIMLFRDDEEALKHWYHPPTALGQGGWFHIKDSYWTLKNTAAVTLQVTVDGVTDSYTIPAGSSERVKHYIELKPRKGKLFSFRLDSSADFRFYGEESGLNGKLWKTQTGYQILNPFGAAGYAQYLRQEGGT